MKAGVGLLLISLLLSPSCRKQQPDASPEAGAESVLRIAIAEPTSCDPAFLTGSNDFQVAANLHDGLYKWSGKEGRVVPNVALESLVDNDMKDWVFKLRTDSRFSDGTKVTAHHFVAAWKRIAAPETASPGADALAVIKGAGRCAAGKGCEVAVTAIDDYMLRVELEVPQPYLPELLASPRFAPVPSGSEAGRRGLVSNGPYRIKEWEPRQKLVLAANPHHPAAADLRFQEVVLRFAHSEDVALAWWKTGEADIVVGLVPLGKILFLRSEFGEQVVGQPRRSVFYLMFNLKREALSSVRVRAALASAIERERLVTQVLGAGQTPAYSFVPDLYAESAGFTPTPCRSFHPFDEGVHRLPEYLAARVSGLELLYNASETLRAILEFSQQCIRKRSGAFLNLRHMEWKSFLALVQAGDYDIARYSLTGGYDPVDFLDNFTTGHPNNVSGYSRAEYDDLVGRVHETSDPTARVDFMQQAHRLLCEDLPAAPVYFSSQVHLVREPLLNGFSPDPEGIVLWRDL